MHIETYFSEVKAKDEPFVYHEIRHKRIAGKQVEYYIINKAKTSFRFNKRQFIALMLIAFDIITRPRNIRKSISNFKAVVLSCYYYQDIACNSDINVHFIGKRLVYAWIAYPNNKIRIIGHANDCLYLTKLEAFILKRVHSVDVISNYAKGQLELQIDFKREINLIRNSYSEQEFKHSQKSGGKGILTLAYFGRFVPMKGLVEFIKMLNKNITDGRQINLDLYGKSNLYLVNSILPLSSEGVNLKYTGYLDPDLVSGQMAKYDAVLLPAIVSHDQKGYVNIDGIPTIFQESLSQGIPVITDAVGGIEEIIWHGVNGIILSRLSYIDDMWQIKNIKENIDSQFWVEYFNALNTMNKYDIGNRI